MKEIFKLVQIQGRLQRDLLISGEGEKIRVCPYQSVVFPFVLPEENTIANASLANSMLLVCREELENIFPPKRPYKFVSG